MAFTTTSLGSAAYSNTEGDSVSGVKRIIGVFWVSDQTAGDDIAADDDFLLSDVDGTRVIGKRAEVAGDDLGILYGNNPLIIDTPTITTMDGGVCYLHFAEDEL